VLEGDRSEDRLSLPSPEAAGKNDGLMAIGLFGASSPKFSKVEHVERSVVYVCLYTHRCKMPFNEYKGVIKLSKNVIARKKEIALTRVSL